MILLENENEKIEFERDPSLSEHSTIEGSNDRLIGVEMMHEKKLSSLSKKREREMKE